MSYDLSDLYHGRELARHLRAEAHADRDYDLIHEGDDDGYEYDRWQEEQAIEATRG